MNPPDPEKENADPGSEPTKEITGATSNRRDGTESTSPATSPRLKAKQGPPRVPEAHDFTLLKPISRGAFGKVFIGCKKKNPDQIYAIKVMKKSEIINKNLIAQVRTERDALAMTHSPFVVEIYYSLQSERNIYLVMEYLVGGDVKSLLAVCGYLEENMATMYIAEITLALEHLHRKGIIHRDLKPDNMLIAGNGHIKLTDFGLSRVSLDVTSTPLSASQMTPGWKMDQYRTPGQILSLRSSLAFSAPRNQEQKKLSMASSTSSSRHAEPTITTTPPQTLLASPKPSRGHQRGAGAPLGDTLPPSPLVRASGGQCTSGAGGPSVVSGCDKILGARPGSLPRSAVTAMSGMSPRTPRPSTPLVTSLTPTLQSSLHWRRSSSMDDQGALHPHPHSSTFATNLSHIHPHPSPLHHSSSLSSTDDVFSPPSSTITTPHHHLHPGIIAATTTTATTLTPTPERVGVSGGSLGLGGRGEGDTPVLYRTNLSVHSSVSARSLRSFREGSPSDEVLAEEKREDDEEDRSLSSSSSSLSLPPFGPNQPRKLQSVPEESEAHRSSSQGSIGVVSERKESESGAALDRRSRTPENVPMSEMTPGGMSQISSNDLTQASRKRSYDRVMRDDSDTHSFSSSLSARTGLTQEVCVMKLGEASKNRTKSSDTDAEDADQSNVAMDCEGASPVSPDAHHAPHKVRITSGHSSSNSESEREKGPKHVPREKSEKILQPCSSTLSGSLAELSSPEMEMEECEHASLLSDSADEEHAKRPAAPALKVEGGGEKSQTLCEEGGGGKEEGSQCFSSPEREDGEVGGSGIQSPLPADPEVCTGTVKPTAAKVTKNVDFLEEAAVFGLGRCRSLSCVTRGSGPEGATLAHCHTHSAADWTSASSGTDSSLSATPERVGGKKGVTHSDFITPQHRPLSLSQLHRTPKEGVRRGPEPREEEQRILGTPDYLAPEILRQEKHGPENGWWTCTQGPAVDWWALGVCFFEFLTGLPPFNDETPELVFRNILARAISWPTEIEDLGEESLHAINSLLTMDPDERPGASEVKSMTLFSKLDWDHLLETEAPFIPQPDNIMDTSYFDPKNELQQLTISAVDM